VSKTVLILGGGVYSVDLIEAAQDAGFEVVVTDQDEGAPGFAVADHAEAVDITDRDRTIGVANYYDIDGVVPINDYGVETAAVVADERGHRGIDPTVARTCTDKAAMRAAWDSAGVPQPSYFLSCCIKEAKAAIERLGYPAILKPANSLGGGSRGVSTVEKRSEIEQAFKFAQSVYEDDDRVLVEALAEGTEHSIEIVSTPDMTTILAVSDKEKTSKPYRVDESVIYPSDSPERERIERAAQNAVEALGIDIGAAHVELAVTDKGIQLFELGARVGGGATADPIVPAVTGVNYFADLVSLLVGESTPAFEPSDMNGVTYRFLTPSPGRVVRIDGVEEVRSWDGILGCRLWCEVGDTIEKVRTGVDRSGSIIAHGETRSAAYELAERAEERIEFYTTDD
jgi:biotin carboxylase